LHRGCQKILPPNFLKQKYYWHIAFLSDQWHLDTGYSQSKTARLPFAHPTILEENAPSPLHRTRPATKTQRDHHQPRCCPPAWETTGATPGWPPPSVAFYGQIYATYVRGSVTGHRAPSCVRQVRTPGSCSRMSHGARLGSRRPRESARPATAATTATTRPRAY
jgi:hypothetical protein